MAALNRCRVRGAASCSARAVTCRAVPCRAVHAQTHMASAAFPVMPAAKIHTAVRRAASQAAERNRAPSANKRAPRGVVSRSQVSCP